jgi:glucokinase
VTCLYWDGAEHIPVATEAAHADFAARNELQAGLRRYLEPDYGHVSYEHVCSPRGLVQIHRYLSEGEPCRRELSAAAIVDAALTGSDSTCRWALDLLISIYGALAGNVALALMASGGVFLGGSLPRRVLPRLREGAFVRAFLDKGRAGPLLQQIPVYVVAEATACRPPIRTPFAVAAAGSAQ